MRASKPHGFVACLFDIYVTSFFIGAVPALWIALRSSVGRPAFAIVGAAVSILIPIVYHSIIAARVAWRSPGEMIAGRFLREGAKVWLNPYRRTRWPLFATMLLVAVVAGDTWAAIGLDENLPVKKVILTVVALGVLMVGMVAVGQGKPSWMMAPTGYLALVTFPSVRALSSESRGSESGLDILEAIVMGLVLLCFMLSAIYAGLRMKVSETAALVPESPD